MTTPTDLSPTALCRDGQAQIRVTVDPETLALYKLLIEQAHCEWPFTDPLVAFFDGGTYWLADGFQRDLAWCDVFAEKGIPLPNYPVLIYEGTLRNAIRYATHEANRHGQPYTKRDRRNLATRLIADSEWTHYSNRQIARIAGLDEKTIRNIRKELTNTDTKSLPTVDTLGETKSTATSLDNKSSLSANSTTPSAENPHLPQMAMFESSLLSVDPPSRPPLPSCYAPTEPHQIARLETPLPCSIIDTHKLTTCNQPASLAFAWRTEDERHGTTWILRPVCRACAKLAG